MTDAFRTRDGGIEGEGTKKDGGLGSEGTIPNEPGGVGVGAGEPTTFEPEEDPEAAARRVPDAPSLARTGTSGPIPRPMSTGRVNLEDMTAAIFDESRTEHRKALRKLHHDLIAWFTTVDAHGEPHSVPVWFFWHDGKMIVFSEPTSSKLHHVRHGSPVLVHLDSGRFGNDVVVMNGTAEISERSAADWLRGFADDYNEKYAEAMDDFGMDADAVVEKYPAVIIVTPTKLMAW